MILIDTDVISEPLRRAPEPRVISWLDAQSLETLFLSAITVAELRFGVANLPVGRRRDELQTSVENQILPLFAGRVRPFDMACTTAYVEQWQKSNPPAWQLPRQMDTLRLLPPLTGLASRHEMSVHSKPRVSPLSTLGMIRMIRKKLNF